MAGKKGCGKKFDGWHYCGEIIQGAEVEIYCETCKESFVVSERFTKGKWMYSHAKGQAKKYVMCEGLRVATVPINSGKTDAKANAHLIESAPPMYYLLKKIMIEHCNNSILYNEIDELLEKARGE